MKKVLFLFFLSMQVLSMGAQESNDRGMSKKFTNLSFTSAKMSRDDMPDLKSRFGAAITGGRTFFLHKPIANVLSFGIDATWFDLNYANYQIEQKDYSDTKKYQCHQGEFSMHLGPSITIEPAKRFALHAYFQYAPTFAALYSEDDKIFYGNYASLWIAGGNISYCGVGLGIESRFGSTTYKPLSSSEGDKIHSKLSGFRAYLTFLF